METAFGLLLIKLAEQAKGKHIPLIGTLELTSRCNLNCKMCYIHNPKSDSSAAEKELTADEWIKIASDAKDSGTLYMILTGGEVFLRSDFERIYESISKMGFSVTIYTNATLINERKAKWLGRIPPSTVGITIYGASRETYHKVCGSADAYDRTVKAIDLLLAEGINVELKTTIIHENANDYERLVEFAYERGLPLSMVDYISPHRLSCQSSPMCRLSPDELLDFYTKMSDIYKRMGEESRVIKYKAETDKCREKLMADLEKMSTNAAAHENAFLCTAGSCDFWISCEGKMIPCGMLVEPSVDLSNKSFNDAWTELLEKCNSIPVCKECRDCEAKDFCDTCPARLKSETGSYDKPARYLCDIAWGLKSLVATNIK